MFRGQAQGVLAQRGRAAQGRTGVSVTGQQEEVNAGGTHVFGHRGGGDIATAAGWVRGAGLYVGEVGTQRVLGTGCRGWLRQGRGGG